MCGSARSRNTCKEFADTSHEVSSGRPISSNHAAQVWSCDFLQVTDLFFGPLFAFFIVELKSRRVSHVGVTRSPTDAWVARTAAGSDLVWASARVFDS